LNLTSFQAFHECRRRVEANELLAARQVVLLERNIPSHARRTNPDDDRRGLAINRALRPDVVLIVHSI